MTDVFNNKSLEELYWDYYHAGRAYKAATGSPILSYINSQMKKDIPDLIEKYFDGSNKKFMRWSEEKFINKH